MKLPGAIVGVLALATACGGGAGGGAAPEGGAREEQVPAVDEFAGAEEEFYLPPDPVPAGEHGTLVRYQEMEDPDVIAGATAYRVMYLSEAVDGEPIVVTGTVVVPRGEAPDEGWKLVSVAHGTSGNADECAPSKFFGEAPVLDLDGPIRNGYVVAVTDYEGLGTPGRHPYLVADSEGRSVIDAAIAARRLPGIDVEARYGIVGYSQGGHAAAAAHDIAADWAPDLQLVGTVAGAPPSETDIVFAGAVAVGEALADPFFLIVAGFAEAYPDADPSMVLTDAGLAVLDGVDHGCFAMRDAIGDTPWHELVRPDAATTEPWATLLRENRAGTVAAESPMLIVHSADDLGVPVVFAETLAARLCGLGQVVELRIDHLGEDHDAAAVSNTPEMFDWIDARMTGEPAASTCR